MKTSVSEYRALADARAPRSRWAAHLVRAFLAGGAICALGEGVGALWRELGAEPLLAGTLTTVCLIFLSALLTGLGLYDRIAAFAGAGTLVPVTGFANSMASCAMEFRQEGFITGLAAKMFTIAGPVIVYGVAASILYGLICYLLAL